MDNSALQGLAAVAIARIAGEVGNGLVLVMTEVLGHFSFKSPLDEHLGELLQETILADQVFGLGVIGHEAFGEFLQLGIGFGLGALACGHCGSLMLVVCCQMTVYTKLCTPSTSSGKLPLLVAQQRPLAENGADDCLL